jgi:phage-related protein
MPPVHVVFYADAAGRVSALEWLDALPPKARDKFIVRIERLSQHGSELRRPEADFLRNGVYELRVRNLRVNYRMLCFFVGRTAVLSHGITKEDRVPEAEIARAIPRQTAFAGSPGKYTHTE